MSEKYQIEATIEKIEADVKNGKIWKIQIKGVGKYLFEKENVRAYTGGIPEIWLSGGSVDKDKVNYLLHPKIVTAT